MNSSSPRMQSAIEALDQLNSQDPDSQMEAGKSMPKSLLYARRMTAILKKYYSDASEKLQLAARAQHLQRWRIPRDNYPKTRLGYKNWRSDCAKMHARTAGDVLTSAGYSMDETFAVQDLILKRNLKTNPEAQALEDVACLVFLEFYLEDFAGTVDEEKLIPIIKKTWAKMSAKGRNAALKLKLPPKLIALVQKAVETEA